MVPSRHAGTPRLTRTAGYYKFARMGQRFDVIAVGGGHNNLVAAHYLAASGLKVGVFERRFVVGGACSTFEFFPGYRTAFTNSPGSLEPKIVKDLALEEHGLRWIRPDPSMVQPFTDGRAFVAWRDKGKVVDNMASFSKHDSSAYYKFFDWLAQFARTMHVNLFEEPPSIAEIAARLRTREDEEAFGKIMYGSIRDLLDEWLESDEVKATVATIAIMQNWASTRTPGTPLMLMHRPLSLASVSVAAQDDPRLQPMRGSTGLPIGGMGSITQAMQRSIEAQGVVVRVDSPVAQICTRNGMVTGIMLESGEEIEGRVVVSNLNPKLTLLKLLAGDVLEPDFRHKVESLKMNGNAFKMVLALSGPPRFRAARNAEEVELFAKCQFRVTPSMDWIDQAFTDATSGHWSTTPMLWGLIPSMTDPTLAPPGHHIMSVNIFHAPYRIAQGNWATEKAKFGQHCIDVLAEYVTNLKDIIVDTRFFSPEDIEKELGLLEAHISHGDVLPGRFFSLRPIAGYSDYRTPVKGLYMTGNGTFPAGNVSGIPGHNAAHKILADIALGSSVIPDMVNRV